MMYSIYCLVAMDVHFEFTQGLHMAPSSYSTMKIAFDEMLLKLVKNEWREFLMKPRNDNERVLQPGIHTMLRCIAEAATTASGGCRELVLQPEPAVVPNRLSDEAVLEVLSEKDTMRILLEVKGSKNIA